MFYESDCGACIPPPPHATSVVTGEWLDGDDNNGVANAGETLTRTYTVENGGTTTLSSICVTDEKFGDDCLSCTVSNNGELPPGELFVCTVSSLVSCFDRLTPPTAFSVQTDQILNHYSPVVSFAANNSSKLVQVFTLPERFLFFCD